MRTLRSASLFVLLSTFVAVSTFCFAAAPDRITRPIVAQQAVQLPAGVPLQARPEFDQGPVDPGLKLSYMTLLTVPSASQQHAVTRLLAQQQDPRSANFHQWLTPEQYGERFGLSPNDLQKIAAWLKSQGFTIVNTARGKNWIVFAGTAAQAEAAFHTTIHQFEVDGETHFANITPPSIPAALSGVVSGIRGLNDFRPKSHLERAKPEYTLTVGANQYLFLAPGDISTMYDLDPLYAAGVDGTGQKLAVMGQTDVYLADLNDFRSGFGLPQISGCTTNSRNVITACSPGNFEYVIVPGNTDPGTPNTLGDDLAEADIDLEWSNAVARRAQIVYVNSPSSASGTGDSWYYTVDNNIAPVITLSYGWCELKEVTLGNIASDETELAKANSFGITFLNSSGDSGAAECDYRSHYATGGYALSYPSSSPSVTGVGGTLIPYTEYTSTYWSGSNDTFGGSALSYIPEFAWNDAQEMGAFCTANPSNSYCVTHSITNWATAQTAVGIVAGGGGVSNCTTVSGGVCQSGFSQPTYQQSLSIAGQAAGRFSPDVSLLASIYWPGFIVCTARTELVGGTDTRSSCDPGGPTGIINNLTNYGYTFGGTSISSPIFAGMVTLLNQFLTPAVPGLGNINPMLYTLAATPLNGAFHPLTSGSNGAYCSPGTPTGQPVALQCPGSGFLGFDASNFDAATSYNLVNGLGSVDLYNLASSWAAARSATTSTINASANSIVLGQSVTLTVTVSSPTAVGTVDFYDNLSGTAFASTTITPADNGVGTYVWTPGVSQVGNHSITANYAGDGYNKPSVTIIPAVVDVVAPDFTLATLGATTHSVLSGQQSLAYTFTVTPTTGGGVFTTATTFSCAFNPTDPTLSNTSCVFSPASIPANTSGQQTVTLNINTAGPNSGQGTQFRRRAENRLPWLPMTLPLAGVVMVGLVGRRWSKYSLAASLCFALALTGFMIACGGGSSTPVISVSAHGSSSSIYPQNAGWTNSTATFTATVSNDAKNGGVTWSVSPTLSGQQIQATDTTHATYTPPTIASGLPSSVTVTATSVTDASKTGNASITLSPTTIPGAYSATVTVTEGSTVKTLPTLTLTVN